MDILGRDCFGKNFLPPPPDTAPTHLKPSQSSKLYHAEDTILPVRQHTRGSPDDLRPMVADRDRGVVVPPHNEPSWQDTPAKELCDAANALLFPQSKITRKCDAVAAFQRALDEGKFTLAP